MGNIFSKKTSHPRNEGDTFHVSFEKATGNFNFNSQDINIKNLKRDCTDDVKLLKECLRNHFFDVIRSNKIPFLDDSFNPIENYISMNFEVLDKRCNSSDGKLLSEREVFQPSEGTTRPPRRILAIGGAGSGKSTVCLKLSEDWVQNENGYMSSFDVVLPILLRDVTDSIEDEIVKICNKAVGKRLNYSFDDWITALDSIGKNLLLLLDGYDEANDCIKQSLHNLIYVRTSEPSSLLGLATVFITTRPNVLGGPQDRIQDCLLVKSCERLLNIKELPFDVQIAYVDNYFVNNPQKGEKLKNVCHKLLETRKLAPLLIFIMCYLYDNGCSIIDGINYWENVVRLISKRIAEREKLLCMTEQDMYNVFVRFGDLCLRALKVQNVYIKILDIRQDFPEHANILETSGILRKPFSFSSSENAALEPVHKSLMEYLALKNVNNRLQQDENERIQCLQSLFDTKDYANVTMNFIITSISCYFMCTFSVLPFSLFVGIDTRWYEATALLEATLIRISESEDILKSYQTKHKAVYHSTAMIAKYVTVEDLFVYFSRCIPLHTRSYDVLRSNPILSITLQVIAIHSSADGYHVLNVYKMLPSRPYILRTNCMYDSCECSNANDVLENSSGCRILNLVEELLQSSDVCDLTICVPPEMMKSLLGCFLRGIKERNLMAKITTNQTTMFKNWLKTTPVRKSLRQKIKRKKKFESCMVELFIKHDKIYLQKIRRWNIQDYENSIEISSVQ